MPQGHPSKRPQVFSCYCREDSGLVRKLCLFVAAAEIAVFRDEDAIPLGSKWREEIDRALVACTSVFVFLCQHAATSEEVQVEYTKALTLRKRVIPLLMDSTRLPTQLQDLQALDMRDVLERDHDVRARSLLDRKIYRTQPRPNVDDDDPFVHFNSKDSPTIIKPAAGRGAASNWLEISKRAFAARVQQLLGEPK